MARKKNCCRLFTDGEELKNSLVLRRVQQFSSSFLNHQGQSRKAVADLFTSGSESKNSFVACAVLSAVHCYKKQPFTRHVSSHIQVRNLNRWFIFKLFVRTKKVIVSHP